MRTVITALVVGIVVTVFGLPAAAQLSEYQSTLQLRYWGAGNGFGFGSIMATDPASSWGATLRMDSRTNPWSFSGRYDSMSITPTTWVWNGASFWDANVHYRFGRSLNSYLGLLAGYGGANLNSTLSPSAAGSASGFRFGAEFMTRQPAGWYFTGEATYGPSWSTSPAGFTGLGNLNVTDLRGAVGYEFEGGWGLEAGWRYLTGTTPSTSVCPGGCNFQFSGVTAALTFRKP